MSSWLRILFFSLFFVVQVSSELYATVSDIDTNTESSLHTLSTTDNHVDTSFSWGGYFQAIGVMCILLAVLWGAVWVVRRYGKFNFIPSPSALPRDALKMEGQLPLGPKKGLVVIRFLDRRLLLGITEQNIILLKDTGLHDERDTQEFEKLLYGAGQHDSEKTEL